MLIFTVDWEAPWRKTTYVVLGPEPAGNSIVYLPGTREARAKRPTLRTTRRETPPPPVAAPSPPAAAPSPPETAPTMPAYDPHSSPVAPAPQGGGARAVAGAISPLCARAARAQASRARRR